MNIPESEQWRVSRNPGSKMDQPAFPNVRTAGGELVAEIFGDSDTVKANAHLIAAAPELLYSLCRLTERVDSVIRGVSEQTELFGLVAEARDAIAKAEGGAS